MGDPFQAFIYGQVLFPVTIALKFGIKLILEGKMLRLNMAVHLTVGIKNIYR